jgi:hypothetical protein
MNKKEITELLQYNLNLKHANESLLNLLEDKDKQIEELKNDINSYWETKQKPTQSEQTIGHQQNEIETLKAEKEFLMQTLNALTKLTNNLIK